MMAFSGTAYLGLSQHPQYRAWVSEGLTRYGVHFGGSRRSPDCPVLFTDVEHALARWVGASAAMLVSSGTTAGQLVARYLTDQQQQLHFAPSAHPALWWPGGQRHINWSEALEEANTGALLLDAIDPLQVQFPPWASVKAQPPKLLVVDDSHLLGHFGEDGRGSWPSLRTWYTGELLVCASLGKALSLPAGVIFGSEATIAQLRSMPQFGGASPPSPAYLYAWQQAGSLIQQQQAILHHHLAYLDTHLRSGLPIQRQSQFPVLRIKDSTLAEMLKGRGITFSSFRYPTPTSLEHHRLVIHAGVTNEELGTLVRVLNEY